MNFKVKSILLVVLGDFNAKLIQWHGKDSSTSERISIESVTSQFGLHHYLHIYLNINPRVLT